MNWLQDKEQIEQRDDGSFVIMVENGTEWVPYHLTQDRHPEIYTQVAEFLITQE